MVSLTKTQGRVIMLRARRSPSIGTLQCKSRLEPSPSWQSSSTLASMHCAAPVICQALLLTAAPALLSPPLREGTEWTPPRACRVAFAQKDVWEGYSGSDKDTVEIEVTDILTAEPGSYEQG